MLFANAVFRLVPDWEASTRWEISVWGASLSAAALLMGWLAVALYTKVWPQRPRYVAGLLPVALALVCGATAAATLGSVRHAQERRENGRERQEREWKSGATLVGP